MLLLGHSSVLRTKPGGCHQTPGMVSSALGSFFDIFWQTKHIILKETQCIPTRTVLGENRGSNAPPAPRRHLRECVRRGSQEKNSARLHLESDRLAFLQGPPVILSSRVMARSQNSEAEHWIEITIIVYQNRAGP